MTGRPIDLEDVLLYAVIALGMGFAFFVTGLEIEGSVITAWILASLPTLLIVGLLWLNGWRT